MESQDYGYPETGAAQRLPGVHTGMTGNVVNLVIQCVLLTFYGLFDILNAFPTIGLVFAIVSAVTSRNPARRAMSLRFAARARTMCAWGTVFNIVTAFTMVLTLVLFVARAR